MLNIRLLSTVKVNLDDAGTVELDADTLSDYLGRIHQVFENGVVDSGQRAAENIEDGLVVKYETTNLYKINRTSSASFACSCGASSSWVSSRCGAWR